MKKWNCTHDWNRRQWWEYDSPEPDYTLEDDYQTIRRVFCTGAEAAVQDTITLIDTHALAKVLRELEQLRGESEK